MNNGNSISKHTASNSYYSPEHPAYVIKDVYNDNLKEELKHISDLVEEYNYIAMVNFQILNNQDTEFPGIVYNKDNIQKSEIYPKGKKDSSPTNHSISPYQIIKTNVDNLKLIQLGITLSNDDGQFPEGISTWQFNFKFDIK